MPNANELLWVGVCRIIPKEGKDKAGGGEHERVGVILIGFEQ